jgi:hypothetical protein
VQSFEGCHVLIKIETIDQSAHSLLFCVGNCEKNCCGTQAFLEGTDSLWAPDFAGFPVKARHWRAFFRLPRVISPRAGCLAGDAVLIAPVSGRIPCKQGILQGISAILAF